jgi:hypothetical protein
MLCEHISTHVGPVAGVLLLTCFNTLSFHLSSAHLFTTLHICLDISHPMVAHLSRCKCGHTINDLGIHLLHCLCESECIVTHDTLSNSIAIVMSKSGVHL